MTVEQSYEQERERKLNEARAFIETFKLAAIHGLTVEFVQTFFQDYDRNGHNLPEALTRAQREWDIY